MSGRIILAGLLLVFTLFTAKAQDSAALKFTESISASGIREHVYVLASDSLEGRETAKPGMQKAARYVSGEFYKMGIPPLKDGTYFQKVPFRKTMPGSLSVATNRKTFTDIQDFYSTQFDGLGQMLSAGIIFAGYGIRDSASGWDDLSGITAKGKAVMIIDGTPKDKKGNVLSGKAEHNRDARVENVSSLDPPVILWVRRDYAERRERLSRSFAGGILSLDAESTEKPIPVITISPEMADALLQSEGISVASYEKKIASRKKPVSVTVGDTLKISARPESVFCTNVLGYIEGTDKKDELVIVTAHLDHLGMRNGDIYYGADDDGSGCAAVLEMAEVLSNAKKEGFAPRRSVLFMTFTGEEKGLFGSEYYVNNPVFPLENTIANLNIDMIGRVDTVNGPATGYVYVIGANRISDTLYAVNERVNRNYSGLKLDYRYNDPEEKMRLYYRSDHYSFIKKGVPSNFYFTGLHPDYHKPTDTPDKIDYEKAARIARLVFLNIWELANMPARPDVKDDR